MEKRSPVLAAVLLAVTCTCSPVAAQRETTPDSLRNGDRIRFTTDSIVHFEEYYASTTARRWSVGVLDSVVSGHIWIRAGSGTLNAPLEVLRTLQVSRATLTPRQVVRRGTLVGAAVGGGLALIAHAFAHLACSNVGLPHEEPSRACDDSRWDYRYDATFTLGSAAMGLGISFALQRGLRDRWVSVRLPRSGGTAGIGAR